MAGLGFGRASFAWPAALAGRAAQGGFDRARALWRAFAHRRAVLQLSEFDDRGLKDIGLLRTDVVGALSQPWHRDPSTVLMMRAVERRAQGRPAAGASPGETAVGRPDPARPSP